MPTFDENVCLKVQRAGTTEVFRLRGAVVKFGYAPGGEHDLVLHDSRLEDVQGVIERQDGAEETGFTPYRLKASSSGIEVEGVRLPPREAAAIRLKYGQQIKVGRYLLTVERDQTDAPASTKPVWSATEAAQSASAWPIPNSLQAYLATSQLFLNYLPEIYRSNEAGELMPQPFLHRYLALFESVFVPLKWTVENFDLWLQPLSAPPEALPWLAGWYGLPFSLDSLPSETQGKLLVRLPHILALKGTLPALQELLHICTNFPPTIVDDCSFNIELKFVEELDEGQLSDEIRGRFKMHGCLLAEEAVVNVIQPGSKWTIADRGKNCAIASKNQSLDVSVPNHFTVKVGSKVDGRSLPRNQVEKLINWFKPAHTTFTLE